jgi:GTPase SAR1 family protein
MNNDSKPIDLELLKMLIHKGMEAMAVSGDKKKDNAVLVIGDTGVGKSTIMSYLAGDKLNVKYEGLKFVLDNANSSKIKIGHEKLS